MVAARVPKIGPIVQRHRKARGLTLEQLAAESGVSRSMLSQIERGQANPTFAVLWSLTRALRIDFADLTTGVRAPDASSPIEIVTGTGTPEIRSADGLCRLRILSPPQLAGATEWYDLEIAPGGALDSEPHTAGAFEHLTVLDESLSVTSAGATRTVGAGETARYPADVAHRIENVSKRPARALLVNLYGSRRGRP